MKHKVPAVYFFLAGIIFSAVAASPSVLDLTLTPRFILLSVFLLLAFFKLYQSGNIPDLKPDLITTCYFLYAVFSCFSLLWAQNKAEALFSISKNILSFLVFLSAIWILKKDAKAFWPVFLKACILLPFVGFAFALWQYSGISNLDKVSLYGITGMNGHKNLYTSFLFINLFFLIYAFLKFQKSWKLLSGVSLLLSLFIIFMLRTKAVWLGLSVTGIMAVVCYAYGKSTLNFQIRFPVFLVSGLIVLTIFMLVSLPEIVDSGLGYNKALTGKDAGNELDNERLTLWHKSLGMLYKHPVAGVGEGNWQVYFPNETLTGLWRAEDLNFTFQRPHNDLLWILTETGLIGFNLFFAVILSLLICLIHIIKTISNEIILPVLCFAFIAGYFTVSFFDFPKERIEHLVWMNLIFAIAYSLAREHLPVLQKNIKVSKKATVIVLPVLVFIVVIGCLRYKGEYFTRELYDAKNAGNTNLAIKKGEKAESFAYSLDPTSVPLAWYTGNAKVLNGNMNGAMEDFKKAFDLNPYNRNVLNDLASAYVSMGNKEEAIKYYRESSRVSPRFDDPKLNLAVVYFNNKQFQLAKNCLDSMYHDSEKRSKYLDMVNIFFYENKTYLQNTHPAH